MKVNWSILITFILSILFSVLLMFLFNSCSIEHHLSKAQKHIDIAKRKGAIIKPDTVWQYNYTKETVYDTVTHTYKEILKKDSSFQTINNTIAPGMSRQERLSLESYYKHLEKMMKLQNDSLSKELRALVKLNGQNKKTERYVIRQENKQPWAWVILSAVILIIILVLKKIFRL